MVMIDVAKMNELIKYPSSRRVGDVVICLGVGL